MAAGFKTGGRRAGSPPSKAVGLARERAALQFHSLQGDFERWVRQVADGFSVVELTDDGRPTTKNYAANPGEAARLVLALQEFTMPKLARSELTGGDGGPVSIEVRKYVADPNAVAVDPTVRVEDEDI
jgi:hypothetical protein